jgi:hypothetical protein
MSKPFKWIEPTEKQIEAGVLQYLNFQVGVFAFKVDTQARYDPRLGIFLPLNKLIEPGTSDILGGISVDGGFAVFFGMEVKRPNGRQSKHQKQFEENMRVKANAFYFVVRMVKDAELALRYIRDAVKMKRGGIDA